MIVNDFEFKDFEPQFASLSEVEEIHYLKNRLKLEIDSKDKLTDLSNTVAEFRTPHSLMDVKYWIARERGDSKIVGFAKAMFKNKGENDHVVWFDISVFPEWRKRGVGKKLFLFIYDFAVKGNKKCLMANTIHTIPAGEFFMNSLGFSIGNELIISQLDINDIDDSLIADWISNAPNQLYTIGLWKGAYPENELDSIIKVKESMNTSPRNNLDLQDMHWTKDELRRLEQFYLTRMVERWTAYVKDNQSKQIIGYSEIFWHSSENNIMYQGDTGIIKDFQGQGIAKWLKAYIIKKVLLDKNFVFYIRVSNSIINNAMLSINRKLGYKIYQSKKTWQVYI